MVAFRRTLLVLAVALSLLHCTTAFDPALLQRLGGNDGSPSDGPLGDDGSACTADLQRDKKNCGRCGHDCLGGACTAGRCEAIELGSIATAPLFEIVTAGPYVFVATRITRTNQVGGIWRIPKSGGAAEPYVNLPYATALAVIGETLYFGVDGAPGSGGTEAGGLYSCPLPGGSPCTPTLIAAATNSQGMTVDQGKVFYGDDVAGRGLMVYAPPAPPAVFRNGAGFAGDYFVDGTDAFYTATTFSTPRRAKLVQIFADGGADDTASYQSDDAYAGVVRGSKTYLLFAAYNRVGAPGGVVRRIPRAGGAPPCDYGGATNHRPYGVVADATRVYWTNMGEGAAEPYTNGSLASCELSTCCSTPEVMWTGDGQPTGLSADADALYFTTKISGAVWKIAKP
jgi:hypothetical protein